MENRILWLAIIFLLSFDVNAKSNQSLCTLEEQEVFSCSLKKKIVSLCSTRELSATTGHLVYRYGIPGQEPEIIYPSDQTIPKNAFSASFEFWAKGSLSSVAFRRESYLYVVYNRSAAFEESERSNGGGIRIFQKEKEIADLWCDEGSIYDAIWKTLNSIGLPEMKP